MTRLYGPASSRTKSFLINVRLGVDENPRRPETATTRSAAGSGRPAARYGGSIRRDRIRAVNPTLEDGLRALREETEQAKSIRIELDED